MRCASTLIIVSLLWAVASLASAEDAPPPGKADLLAKARAANEGTRFGEAWECYQVLLEDHAPDLELLTEIARGAANVLLLERAEVLVAQVKAKSTAMADKRERKKLLAALREVSVEVRRIRDQEKHAVPKLVKDAIFKIHKHNRAIPKAKMRIRKKHKGYVSYSLLDKHSGPHLWGSASETIPRGSASVFFWERHRNAELARKRYWRIVGQCASKQALWEKSHHLRTKTNQPKLFVSNQEDAEAKGHPAAKYVRFSWDKKEPLLSQVASVSLNPPVLEETGEVDPDGIWMIVIMLDSRAFKGP